MFTGNSKNATRTIDGGNISKAEALHQAQIDLIQGKLTNNSAFVHPYYWAAFILIGNGL